MLVLEIGAALLVLAATVSAVRTGMRTGEWQGVLVIAGIAAAVIAFYFVLESGSAGR